MSFVHGMPRPGRRALMPTAGVTVIAESLGGSPLSRAAQRGELTASWVVPRPTTPDEWRARVAQTRDDMDGDWWTSLAPACAPSGAAAERIARVAGGQGIVVTTGQQPGLFGGPLYTWVKALSALALADAIEEATGIPAAPVFWAATDDSDFAEASWTMLAMPGHAERLALAATAPEGTRMADVPLGEVGPLLAALEAACGSAADAGALEAVRKSYRRDATVGGAYVALLRSLLEPLGVAVLDAAHPAVGRAAHSFLVRALDDAGRVSARLRERDEEIRQAGFDPQVTDVDGRTLVFALEHNRRERILQRDAARVAREAVAGSLSPNVLLRPVMERILLPSVAYVAGPGEIAYFAQVSVVADALQAPQPLAVPRWSCTVLEPRIADLLQRYDLTVGDLADPHTVESRHARASWPSEVAREFEAFLESARARGAALREAIADAGPLLPPAVTDGAARDIDWVLQRLERRISAAVKRREARIMRDLATLRAALYPGGVRQERALNLVPLLARHGAAVFDALRDGAGRHARLLMEGTATPRAALR